MSSLLKNRFVNAADTRPVIIEKPEVVQEQEPRESMQAIEQKKRDIIKEAHEKAALIIEDAKDKAAALITEAESNVSRIHDDAYDEGYETGYNFGLDQIQEKRDEMLNEAQTVLDEAMRERRLMIADAEKEIIALTLAITKKVIDIELQVNQNSYLSLIKNAIKNLQDSDDINIRINSTQYEKYIDMQDYVLQTQRGDYNLTVSPESAMQPGDIIVRTDNGAVDAGVNTQIQSIERAFLPEE